MIKNIDKYYFDVMPVIRKGGVRAVILLTVVLLFIAFQSVLIYAFFLSTNISYGAAAPKVILDKTEEIYITKLASVIEFSGLNFAGGDYEKIALANTNTIETEFISLLDSSIGDSLETILTSKRLLFNRPYNFKSIRSAVCVLEEYARINLKDKNAAKAVNAINSILSLAMIPQIGIDSEKALICDMITTAFKHRTTKLIDETLKSGVRIDCASLDKLTAKLVKYEMRCDGFAAALRHEKEACARIIGEQLYARRPGYNKYNQFAAFALVKTSELYYGGIAEQYAAVMDKAIAASGLKFDEADRKLEELSNMGRKINRARIYPLALLKSEINPLVIFMLPSYDKFHRDHLLQSARSRAAIIKLALRRAENNKSVVSVEEAKENSGAANKNAIGNNAPAGIDAVKNIEPVKSNGWIIIDPFTDKELLYKKSETGEITIYSAGYDMKDDGGSFSDERDIEL
jgi:hypothetical protein